MQVAIELTPLGSARYSPRNRTGIFRVCAEMVTALAACPEIQLILTAFGCRGEAEAEVRALGVTAPFHRGSLDRLLQPAVHSAFAPRDWHPGRALSDNRRKAVRTFVQFLELFGGAPGSVARRATVCHSPYHPPSLVGWTENTKATRIVTVHDVLPLTHPQFFPDGDRTTLSRVLDDIRSNCVAHCVSEYTRKQLIQLVPEAAERSFTAPLAANLRRFHPSDATTVAELQARLSLGERYILCVGTLDRRKNLELAVRAFDQVRAVRSDVQLVLTGAPTRPALPLDEVLEPYPHARSGCVVTGFVSDGDLPALYSGAQLVLYPSLAEGFGLPALEAMACGTPVLASNRTSLPEVVGDSGLTLDVDDPGRWSTAILELLESPERRSVLSQAGLARAREFSWENTARRLVDAYRHFSAT